MLGLFPLGSAALGGLSGAAQAPSVTPVYDPSGHGRIETVKGRRYLWTKGSNDISLINSDAVGNTETLTETGEFIARWDHVTITGIPNAEVTGTVQPQIAWDRHLGGLVVQSFRKHPMLGERRLFFVGFDGFINLYEYGFTDALADQFDALAPRDVEDEVLTRGYTCGTSGRKRFQRGKINISSWDPTMSVDGILDGVNEVQNVQDEITKSRTEYYEPFDAAPYAVSNNNDDHDVEHRQNYSVVPPETVTLTIDNTGFDPDLYQESTEGFTVRAQGTYCQLRIRNTTGRLAVLNTYMEANPGPRKLETVS